VNRNKWFGWLFSDCPPCDVLFWMILGSLFGALGALVFCAWVF
jgi:hypothetical protein